jgi:hypothetical protein
MEISVVLGDIQDHLLPEAVRKVGHEWIKLDPHIRLAKERSKSELQFASGDGTRSKPCDE